MAGPSKRGAGASSRKAAGSASAESTAEGSYIVFSNAKDEPKTKTKGKKPAPTETSAATADSKEIPKKPDTRSLIGGASWTGKLPMTLLSELCQRQKWDKPEYTMQKDAEGYYSAVILKAVHAKTKEKLVLPAFRLPLSLKKLGIQDTAVEARHFAATYTLFRICSMKNVHLMLPPKYRTLWKGPFQDLKIQDIKNGKGWMYEENPFMAKEAQDQKALSSAANSRVSTTSQHRNESGTSAFINSTSSNKDDKFVKGWAAAPRIDMARRLRMLVEDMIKQHIVWNPHNHLIPQTQHQRVINDFVRLGFRSGHVEEALEICKDTEEVLEWLLIHVPEDDLPEWSLPEGYVAGVSMASGNLKREAAISRLASAGYSADLCARVLDEQDEDETRAAESLQDLLLDEKDGTTPLHASKQHRSCDLEIWEEEMITLEAIFGDRYGIVNAESCRILLNLGAKSPTLFIRKSKLYPATPPILTLSKELPAYIRLSAYRQALVYARSDLLGIPMIFNLVDWFEAQVPRIVHSPGKLSTLVHIPRGSSHLPASDAVASKSTTSKSRHSRAPLAGDTGSLVILQNQQERLKSAKQQKMLAIRKSLPAWRASKEIIDKVMQHQVTIISGETGSGKSTQCVQFVLDDMIEKNLGSSVNILCTQPRRISALGLADRVSEERCSIPGQEVGYAIRGESRRTRGKTKITFMTTGVLLRQLQTSGGSSHHILQALSDVSHVFIDEVHERSLDTDFLLILLQTVLRSRQDFKLVLMSATLDADIFERYFQPICTISKVYIPGRTYPVVDRYLDDVISMTQYGKSDASNLPELIRDVGMHINYDLIAEVVQAIDTQLDQGGILIFLPGVAEINRTVNILRDQGNIFVLPLHAGLSPAEQKRVFDCAPRGKRKVVVSTNVAETSITIEDIIAVIDTGKVKETRFDPTRNMVTLKEVWISRAAAKQRRGRAGRLQAGTCFKLYTRNAEDKMVERPDPEILRVPLEQLCLSVRAMGIKDITDFLAKALTPPRVDTINAAILNLKLMGAFDGDHLTALGRHLAMIPADLRLGKLMVYGALLGCLEACVTIAAVLTIRSPFLTSHELREEVRNARLSFSQDQGDLIADLKVYEQWFQMSQSGPQRDVRTWCSQTCLSFQTLNDIAATRSQYIFSLQEIGFIPSDYTRSALGTAKLNAHNSNLSVLRALVAGAFYPQLARIEFPDKKYTASVSGAVEQDPDARSIKYFTRDAGRVFIHPSSTLFGAQTFVGNSSYMAYFTKMETAKVFIRDLAPFNAYTLLMFAGNISIDRLGRGLIVDEWLRLRGWARIGVLVGRLRQMVDRALSSRMENVDSQNDHDIELMGIVRKLIELDGMDR